MPELLPAPSPPTDLHLHRLGRALRNADQDLRAREIALVCAGHRRARLRAAVVAVETAFAARCEAALRYGLALIQAERARS